MTKLSRLALVIFWAAQIYTSAVEAPNRSLGQYYETMSDRGKSAFPNLSYRSEVTFSNGKKVAFYLVTGDIFQFVGESTRTAVWPVDAMLVSTNVELDVSYSGVLPHAHVVCSTSSMRMPPGAST